MSISSLLTAHERLIVIAVLVVAGWFTYGKYLDHADTQAKQVAQQTLAAAQQQQLVVAQQQAQYLAMQQQDAAKWAVLVAAISKRDAAAQQQQKNDATAPIPDVARRIATLAAFDPAWIATTPTGTTLTDAAVRATAETLEQVPALTQDVADQKSLIAGKTKEIETCNTLVSAQKEEITKNGIAADAKLTQVKIEARKSKRKIFIIGFIAGFAAGRVHTW